MPVTFGNNTVKTYKPSDLPVRNANFGEFTKSVKGILKDTSTKSLVDCYVPLDPYARSIRHNFYFEEQFDVEFDDDGRGKSIFLESLDLVGPSPSSSDDRGEVLLEHLAWNALHQNSKPGDNRKNCYDDALDLLMGFEEDLQGDEYRYDEESGEVWVNVDMDFI